MRRKLISVLLLVVMLLLTFSFVTLAEDVEEEKQLPPLGKYAEAVNTLSAIGIIEAEEFDVSSPVKRGEFISAVMKLCGVYELLSPCETSFSDVSAENPYSGAIKAAVDMGIIKGFGDGTFRPDDTVTSEQAIKIIVSVLGYEVHAAAAGGYSVGYISVGYTLGLLTKVILGQGEACTWGDGAQIIFNALDTDILYNTDMNGTYKSFEGNNPLTKWHDMGIMRGVVEANKNTSLTGGNCSDSHVFINGENISVGKSSISDKLGYLVDVYYTKNLSGEKEVVSYALNNNIKTYTIDSENILGESNINKIVYADGDDRKELNISGAPFIYNKKYAVPSAAKLNIADGNIVVIDNDANGVGDVVIINETETIFVDKTNPQTYTVTDAFTDAKYVFDVSVAKNDITFVYDGEEVEFKKIKSKNVLTVQKSEDSSVVTVYIANKSIKATALEVDDEAIIFSDGAVLPMSGGVKADTGHIALGEEKKYYLTYDGKIGGVEISSGEGKYGYLIAAAPDGNGLSASKSVTFRIFGTDGKAKNYVNDNKIYINETPCETSQSIMSYFTSGGQFEHQLIRFVTNADGKITKIFTALNNTAEPFDEKATQFTLDYYYNYDVDTGINHGTNSPGTNQKMLLWAKVDDSYGTFSNVVSLKGTICIKIPEIAAGKTLLDYEKDMQVVNNVAYFNRTSGTDYRHVYNLRAYDMNEGREAAVLVFSDPHSGGSGSIPAVQHIMVDYVAETLDDEGYPTIKIYGFSQNGKVEYEVDTTSSQITSADLKLERGDVIRVATSPDVIRIVKLFTPYKVKPATQMPPYSDSNPEWLLYKNTYGEWVMRKGQDTYYKLNSPWYDEMGVLIHGDVKGVTTNGITLGMNTKDKGYIERIFPVLANYSRYYVYDEAKNTIKKGSVNDIDPDNSKQSVVIRVQYNSAYEVFIYNWKDDVSASWIGGY